LRVIRSLGFQDDLNVWNGTVLRIVDDSAHGTENRRKTCGSKQEQNAKQERSASHNNFNLLENKDWAPLLGGLRVSQRNEEAGASASRWREARRRRERFEGTKKIHGLLQIDGGL
jgi:hypothetical protein